MKKNLRNQSQSGYTLIELLLGITISVMIFITAASVLALLFRSDVKTKRVETLEQTKNDVLSELSTQIRWAENIDISNKNILVLDGVTYRLESERLWKNSDPLTTTDVSIKTFDITDYSNSKDVMSLEVNIDMEHKIVGSTKDTLRFVVSQRKTTFEE